MGKTSFVLNIAQNVALNRERPMTVGFFSLEMSKEQLFMRLLTSEARIDAHRLRSGFLSADDYGKLVNAIGTLESAKIFIDDTASIGVLEMRAKARRLQAEHGLHLLIIDYIQLMQGRGRFDNRQQELASISRSLKGLAKELNVPIIALSQLSRATETRSDHRPQLSDLRESGALEQDADVVMFIFRPGVYEKDNPRPENVAEIIIAKQRNGPIGTANLAFLNQYTRFENIAQGSRAVIGRGRPFARVDLDALARELSRPLAGFVARPRGRRPDASGQPRRPAARPPGVIGVVKANAYGHGAVRVGLALEAAGAAMLACADIEEGVLLRRAGVRVPILVFGALSIGDVDGVFDHDLTPTVSTPSAAQTLERRPAPRRQVRLSLPSEDRHRHEPARVSTRSARSHDAADRGEPGTWRSTASTPTSRPPTSPRSAVRRAADRFERRCATLAGARPPARGHPHANSAAHAARRARLVRLRPPGLLLYGLVPPPLATTLPLEP